MAKGILLAGGLGTRLQPLSFHENKHFLPVWKKRMIEYPIGALVGADIRQIILVTGGCNPGSFLNYLKNGYDLGIEKLYYAYQEGEEGIAAALGVAQSFMSPEEESVVILGDNYFEGGIRSAMVNWTAKTNYKRNGAHILLKEVASPEKFGVVEIRGDKILSIEEKPKTPKSNLAITGCYCFDEKVWSYIPLLKPSQRGELEVTDILNFYLQNDLLTYSIYNEFWSDMGTFETLREVTNRQV